MSLFSGTKREITDDDLGLLVTREGKHLRVEIGDRSVLFTGSSPEQFAQHYRSALEASSIPLLEVCI